MDFDDELCDSDNTYKVFDVRDIPSLIYLGETVNDETHTYDMTSLGVLMLLSDSESRTGLSDTHDSDVSNRLSLAYERLHTMPQILMEELSPYIKTLDISYNEFETLESLAGFKHLTTLICDHNNITSLSEIPYMPKLEILWLNHCKINDLYPWANKLQQSCPNLRYLSLMANPAAPSYLNGGNFYDYLQYRLFMISLFPRLIHLDDRAITTDQRNEAERLYKRPLLERIASKPANMPLCLRTFKNKVTNLFAPVPGFAHVPEKNIIV